MLKLYPVDMIDFQDMFRTEEACIAYLCLIRWPEGFRCPRCQHSDAWKLKKGMYRCKGCRRDISVTAGTIFQDVRKPLRLWFQAMWYSICQKQGVSALGLQKALGLGSYETAWTWLHKLRTAMVRPGRDRLSGTVEVDETFVGGPKPGKRGRGASGKVLVLVAVEDKGKHGIGRIRLAIIPDASGLTLQNAVSAMIEPGSTVRTDGWSGYKGKTLEGYEHHIVEHLDDEPGEDLSPLVHRIASLLKRWLLGTHQGGPQSSHLHYYLDEFTFRFNRRTSRSRGQLFYTLVQHALLMDPAPFESLKAR